MGISVNILLFSCKNKSNNLREDLVSLKREKSNKEVNFIKLKDSIVNDLDFFNNLDNLGIGLLKVNISDSLIVINKDKVFIENFYAPTITPVFFKPDYGIFYLICTSKEKEYFEIQIRKGKTAKLIKTKNIKFLKWETFLLNTTGVSSLDWKKNPLRRIINNESKTIDVNEDDEFKVIEVKREWIKISNEGEKVGWLKWRKENQLLIDVSLLM